MIVKMGSSSPIFGVKIPKIFELPPPSYFLKFKVKRYIDSLKGPYCRRQGAIWRRMILCLMFGCATWYSYNPHTLYIYNNNNLLRNGFVSKFSPCGSICMRFLLRIGGLDFLLWNVSPCFVRIHVQIQLGKWTKKSLDLVTWVMSPHVTKKI